jgi:hypothetical protein
MRTGSDRYRIVTAKREHSTRLNASMEVVGDLREVSMLENHDWSADTASVLAARQLAEEAKLRRLPPGLRRRRPLVVPPLPVPRPAREAHGDPGPQ